jgi:hypothetical protein
MFTTKAELSIPILSDGEKRCTVRWPTDVEFCERSRKRVIIRRTLGNGRMYTEVPNAEAADGELFRKIRVGETTTEWNDAEASLVIDRLEMCRVVDAIREGNEFVITMQVPGGRVKHRLQMPNQKDVSHYGTAAVRSVQTRHHSEDRVRLEPSGDMWATCKGVAEGYGEGSEIPIIHKDVAVVEMLSMLRQPEEEPDPEE